MNRTATFVALAFLVPALAEASCGSAFCTVNTNWTAESASVDAGSSFDLRYEFIKQDQPRTGTDDIAVGQVPRHHDEVRTYNRNLVASFSHTFSSGWGLSIVAPLTDRDHLHIHNHHGAQLSEQWQYQELGDVRVTGRYQLPLAGDAANPSTAGLLFGVKLPTGSTSVTNAAGSVAERSLQPGTGTTDLLLGAYYHQRLPASDISWFAQAQVQQAIAEHAGYKPGGQLTADLGVRKNLTEKLGGLVQLNMVVKRRDSGAEAEPEDSGSRSLFVSPGLAYTLSDNMQVYGFIQQPLYQNVNGVQLTARRAATIGISGRF
ncbi:transporter [Noviherbaspirillum galbum]|uniref:Transporter n=1 Tax=Noviherbaspirillum galbum TaxID=2709383 RepID=A0A6B3SVJ6_9BURK|nr:transporter [Noviherbaspirillum galbum]NEX62402.1 transporter [Noviherbaspirillum galbum]